MTWDQKAHEEKVHRALKALEVYEQFREELNYISSSKQRYNTVNRNVMTRAVRRFCYAMEVAIQGDPEVFRGPETKLSEDK